LNATRPVRRSRTAQRDATRRRLVAAGLKVVAREGFAGATTAAIARASGTAHGTVFVHFRTRDALVVELVSEVGRTITSHLATLAGEAPTLSAVLDAHLAALGQHEVLYARLLADAPALPLAARAHTFALQSGVAFRLRSAYAMALQQGQVRDLDATTVTNIWISLTNHYLLNRDLFAPGKRVIAERAAELKAQLFAVIAP
jgi:AcrR family transcriptional regulator